VLDQREAVERAHAIFSDQGTDITRLMPVFENAGICTRYSCVPLDWYAQAHGWKERSALFAENAVALLGSAAEACLERAGVDPGSVDAVVTVTTSGMTAPSLEARLMAIMPLRRDLHRLPIFGLGCAGGVLGLARAAALARAIPGSKVLFLVVELCGLTFRNTDTSNSNVVATALFGDGAAAALLSSCGPGNNPSIAAWGEYTWPDSLEVMGWRIEDDGFGVLFSRDIPGIVRAEYRTALDGFLSSQGLALSDLDGAICHPGGAKVIEALEAAFGMPHGAMSDARQVLRDYGNMSAATVMFVLDAAWRQGLSGRHLLSSLGPGFSAGFALLDAA
jgi:alkylresorcinol/alkylpyrone synthase